VPLCVWPQHLAEAALLAEHREAETLLGLESGERRVRLSGMDANAAGQIDAVVAG
jgi:hypothetical protein